MIAGLDSSFSRPTPVVAARARAAGVGLWSGYIATKGGVNLASPWDLASFDIARQVGGTPIAFCSGWDDPVALKAKAADWNVRLCLDVEAGIRGDGAWVDQWLAFSGAGLYGNASVHFETGQLVGRGAPFNIVSGYFGYDPKVTWEPWLTDLGERPAGPCGWQWVGDHTEFGLSVDRGWYDDWFGAAAPREKSMILLGATDNSGVFLVSGSLVSYVGSPDDVAALQKAGVQLASVSGTLVKALQAAATQNQGKISGTVGVSGSLTVG